MKPQVPKTRGVSFLIACVIEWAGVALHPAGGMEAYMYEAAGAEDPGGGALPRSVCH